MVQFHSSNHHSLLGCTKSYVKLSSQVPGSARADPPQCLSLAWSADGQTLFAGYSDNLIRVWQVRFFLCCLFFYGISESVAHALKLALWVFMIGSFFFLMEQMIYPVPHQVSVAGTR